MSDFTNELVRLGELREKGLITQEEFDAAKAKLLGESAGAGNTVGPPPMPPSEPPQSRPSAIRPPPSDDIPPGIKGWSWGAFLWNWIWAIFNNTWIGLLALIPGVNIVMIFVLGVKGREWAWKNKKWDSVEHFNRVQRKWSLWGIWLVVIGLVLAFLVFAASLLFMGMAGSKMSETDFMQAVPSTQTNDASVIPEDAAAPMSEESATEAVVQEAAPVVAEDAMTDTSEAVADVSSGMAASEIATDAATEQAAAEQARQQAELAKIKAESDAAKAEAAKAKKAALKAEKALAEQRRRQEEDRRAAEELAAQQEQMRCPYSRDQPLTCSSHGSKTAYCDWNFSACGNPRLSKKESKTTCNGKVNWDPDNNQIIVMDGCRGQFVPVQ